jgi:hypothetical protein
LGLQLDRLLRARPALLSAHHDEFKTMVKNLHEAGIEVVLDVVYNHTAEGNQLGPTLSFRGIDNAVVLPARRRPRYYDDVTGCGNTLDLRHPRVLQMVTDSLRYWVEEMHVDGFRFDLATTLAREDNGYDLQRGVLQSAQARSGARARQADRRTVGRGHGRLSSRRFSAGLVGVERRIATRAPLLARRRRAAARVRVAARRLERLFNRHGRRPRASINFVTVHDGFTLADLVSYNTNTTRPTSKTTATAPTTTPAGTAASKGRPTTRRSSRCASGRSATSWPRSCLSLGVPMLLAGDEFGHSQRGNNNAYCQDNEISWIDWNGRSERDLAFEVVRQDGAAKCAATIRRFSAMRSSPAARGRAATRKDIMWYTPAGIEMTATIGAATAARSASSSATGRCSPCSSTPHDADIEFTLPDAGTVRWHLMLDTALDDQNSGDDGRGRRPATTSRRARSPCSTGSGMTPRELVGERYDDALGGAHRPPPRAKRSSRRLTTPDAGTASPAHARAARRRSAHARRHARGRVLGRKRALDGQRRSRNRQGRHPPLRDTPVVRFVQRGGDQTYDTRRVTLPFTVSSNAYRVTLDVRTYGHAGIDIIAAPARAYLPAGEMRVWGLAVQLYTLRSQRNWGIGDFGDLERMCEIAGDAGASLVGINPLHASHRSDPEAASPYAPTSRRFLNWLAIDVEAVPEARDPDVQHYIASVERRPRVAAQQALRRLHRVAMVKAPALKLCFAGLSGGRTEAFAQYVTAGGEALKHFAIHEALVARYGRNGATLARRAARQRERSDRTFAREPSRARSSSRCTCNGARASSSRAWPRRAKWHGVVALPRPRRRRRIGRRRGLGRATTSRRPASARRPTCSTPRARTGGSRRSRRSRSRDAYAAFAALLADNMRDAGALRIDHAMSLMRLFWIPRGGQPARRRVRQLPVRRSARDRRRESVRAQCIVIGEDLGTVPDGFRDKMAANNILSYRILLFERDGAARSLPPDAYPELALATTGTHDLPPLAAWLEGEDIGCTQRLL